MAPAPTNTETTRANARNNHRPAIPKSPIACLHNQGADHPRLQLNTCRHPVVGTPRLLIPGAPTATINFGGCSRLPRWPVVWKTGGSSELEPGPFAHRADHRDPHD